MFDEITQSHTSYHESSIITINPAQLAIQRSNLGEKTLQHYFYLLLNNDCKVKRQTQQRYAPTSLLSPSTNSFIGQFILGHQLITYQI